jgi:hypothetical protein
VRSRSSTVLTSLIAGVLAAALTMTLAPAPATARAVVEDELLTRLRAIPGLTIVSETQPTGYRFFVLTYAQPVDHRRPAAGTYTQRLTLLHRDTGAPVVLSTSGYGLPADPGPSRAEPTRLLDGNQVSVEHRWFTPSRPEPADWRYLTIWQEASDEHRIVQALKSIYAGKWIQTGASKGGMTSVYHRRFYPNDVDGVVAYVAPNDHINPADRAYDRFFARMAEVSCGEALEDLQHEALVRRDRLVRLLKADAAANGYEFRNTIGTLDRAFEMSILDFAWAFWQFVGEAGCNLVPAVTAPDQEIYEFIDAVVFFGFYTDQGLEPYLPYYYQAATQLGWPSLKFEHLRGLTRYEDFYQANSMLPAELRSRHNPLPMLDVDHWVRTRSERMLFIYGENDPWGAERFTPSRRDSYLYVAPGANHGANIGLLPEADAAAATATLRRWAGLAEEAQPRLRATTIPDDDMLVDRRRGF